VKPGTYWMTWGGYRQRVTVWQSRHGLMVTPPSGFHFSLDTVPEAKFEVVS
jgi:hypothetical protein